MSDNKLSREIDCMECEFHQLGGIYVCIEAENPKADNSKRRCKLFQPKSLDSIHRIEMYNLSK